MWIKFTPDYTAGILAGAGFGIFFLSMTAQSDLLSPDFLTSSGAALAGLALILGGGGMKLRLQAHTDPPQSDH